MGKKPPPATRSSLTRRFSGKKMFLNISQSSHENSTSARVSFLIKLRDLALQLYLKKESGTGVFLRILQNF